MIVHGVNYYPQDIEDAVQDAFAAVHPGCVAAFSSDEAGGDGGIKIVFEIGNPKLITLQRKWMLCTGQLKNVGLVHFRVLVAINEKSIPKTASGKIRRKATRCALNDGELVIIHEHNNKETFLSMNNPQTYTTTNESGNCTQMEEGNVSESAKISDDFDRITSSHFGNNVDHSMTWEELGMTSMLSIQLRDSISDSFIVNLDPDCFERCPNPESLKSQVVDTKGTPFSTVLPRLPAVHSARILLASIGRTQFVCSLAVLVMISCASYLYGMPPLQWEILLLSNESLFLLQYLYGCYHIP